MLIAFDDLAQIGNLEPRPVESDFNTDIWWFQIQTANYEMKTGSFCLIPLIGAGHNRSFANMAVYRSNEHQVWRQWWLFVMHFERIGLRAAGQQPRLLGRDHAHPAW